eukprot:jgi/Botrbrau1/19050/Bobra.0100s0074.1
MNSTSGQGGPTRQGLVIEWEECPICGMLVEIAELPAHCEEHYGDGGDSKGKGQSPAKVDCPIDSCRAKLMPWDLEEHLRSHRKQQEEVALAIRGAQSMVVGYATAASKDTLAASASHTHAGPLHGAAGGSYKRLRNYRRIVQEHYGDGGDSKGKGPVLPAKVDCPIDSCRAKAGCLGILRNICESHRKQQEEVALAIRGAQSMGRIGEHAPMLDMAPWKASVDARLLVYATAASKDTLAASASHTHAGPLHGAGRGLYKDMWEHFESKGDAGFGCGYRNIQIVVSHLLQRSPGALALGASWLEVAWAAGFDPEGGAQLQFKVRNRQEMDWNNRSRSTPAIPYGLSQTRNNPEEPPCLKNPLTKCQAGRKGRTAINAIVSEPPYEFVVFTRIFQLGSTLTGISRVRLCVSSLLFDGCNDESQPSEDVHVGHMKQAESLTGMCCCAGERVGDRGPNHIALLRWVWEYFRGKDSGVPNTFPPPRVYLSGQKEYIEAAKSKRFQTGSAACLKKFVGELTCPACPVVACGDSPLASLSVLVGRGRLCRSPISNTCQCCSYVGRPPLYFQHEGHSRTIIGIERRGSASNYEYTLIILDPSTRTEALKRALMQNDNWELGHRVPVLRASLTCCGMGQGLLKRGPRSLQKAEYQLLFIQDGIAGESERQALKTITAAEVYRDQWHVTR